jgi:hypothetical protein
MDNKDLLKQIMKIMNSDPKQYTINEMKNNYDDEDYWKAILKMMKFENDFIKECSDEINLKYLLKYQVLDNEILNWLNRHYDLTKYYDVLLEYQVMPDNLLIKYLNDTPKDKIDWKLVGYYQDVGEELLTKYKDNFDMDIISEHQFLTLKYILLNHEKINWKLLPTNLRTKYLFNDSFVITFSNKPIWDTIGWMDKVSLDCIWKYKDNITEDGWLSILEYKDLTIIDIEKILEIINNKKVWDLISSNQKLNEEFYQKYTDKLNWSSICLFQDLTWDIVRKYHDKILLKYLSKNDCLNKEFIDLIKENKNLFSDELEEYEFDLDDIEHMPPIF